MKVASLFAGVLSASLGIAAAPALAQSCVPSLLGADRRGAERSIARAGDLVYLVAGAALEVVDVSDPTAPQLLGWVNLDGEPEEVVVSASLAVLRHRRFLTLVSIAMPSAPEVVGTFPFPSDWDVYRVAATPGLAFLAAYESGLRIIDVSNPAQPSEIAAWTLTDTYSVAISGDYAYVSTPAGLHVLDVGDPAAPVLVNVVAGAGGSLDLSGNGRRLARSGHCGAPHHDCAVVRFLDLANPVAPVERSRVDIDGYNVEEVAMSGGRAFVLLDGKVEVYDLANLANPVYLGALWPERPWDLAASGTQLFVADYVEGLLIASLANPSMPQVVGRIASRGGAAGLHIVDHYAVTSFGGGVRAFDLTDPTRLSVAAELAVPPSWPYGIIYGFAGVGRAVLVGAYLSHVEVVDLEDPIAPEFVASFGSAEQFPAASFGTTALVVDAHTPDGVSLWDISTPALPLELGVLPVYVYFSATFALSRNMAFVDSGPWAGDVVRAFDVSNPAAPVQVGELSGLRGEAMLTSDRRLWISDRENLRLYDITDPAEMTIVSSVPIAIEPSSLARSGSLVAASGSLSSFDAEAVLLDYRLQSQPVEVARFDSAGSAGSVAFAPGLLIVADGSAGISVYSSCQPFADGFESGDTSAWSDAQP